MIYWTLLALSVAAGVVAAGLLYDHLTRRTPVVFTWRDDAGQWWVRKVQDGRAEPDRGPFETRDMARVAMRAALRP
jgi:hypothetical protein